MNIIQHTAWDADDEDFEAAPCLVLHSARHIDYNAFAQFDLLAVEAHLSLSIDYVVNLVGALVIMKFGIGDFQMMHFRSRAILFFK